MPLAANRSQLEADELLKQRFPRPRPVWRMTVSAGVVQKSDLTVAIPTYGREKVLIDSIHHLLSLNCANIEILVLDQSAFHLPEVQRELATLHGFGRVRWLRLREPSIPKAMNCGLI